MAAPQYTTCVQPQNYKHPNLPGGSMSTWGDIFSILSSGGLGLIKRLCQYLLHGKLVCLGGDRCVIGRMAAFNTVDDKSGFEKLDNDFGIRIVLCPTSLGSMGRGEDNRVPNHEKAILGPQGELIEERPNMPDPRDPGSGNQPSSKFKGVYVEFLFNNFGPPVVYPTSADEPFYIPVLHCEIEGDRIAVVCAALSTFSNPVLDAFCSIPVIGWVTCWLVTLALAPVIAAVFATAWVAGSNDHRDFDKAGSLTQGDTVVITGRWVYDAGHQGWNELHPVKSVQKIDEGVCDSQDFEDLWKRWCVQTMQVPPPREPDSTDPRPSGMSPEQETVWGQQVKPVNRWTYHPVVDGCGEPPPEPPK